MAKLTFPAMAKPYRGFVGQLQGWLSTAASFIERNPGAASVVRKQIEPLLNSAAGALVENADTVTVKNSAGTVTADGTATVTAAGVISGVGLAATKAIISSAQELTDVEPSGSYATKVTFTVAAGVITAIVLS